MQSRKVWMITTILLVSTFWGKAQSLEVMPGTERLFLDVQWLKPIFEESKWSLFNRTRATVDYEGNTSFYNGSFINYTTKQGIGCSLIGKLSTNASGFEAGLHYFKITESFMVFSLVYLELQNDPSYSFFAIARYRPELGNQKLYTSLELYSNFDSEGHRVSFQGLRLGLDKSKTQFGIASNFYGFGADYSEITMNPGVFIRREF